MRCLLLTSQFFPPRVADFLRPPPQKGSQRALTWVALNPLPPTSYTSTLFHANTERLDQDHCIRLSVIFHCVTLLSRVVDRFEIPYVRILKLRLERGLDSENVVFE